MSQHSARSHAVWSASATARRWACPGSLVLEADRPDDESIHSARGTAAHEVSEACLRSGEPTASLIGREIRTRKHTVIVDEEIAASAQVYVDYVAERRANAAKVWIEQRFDLGSLGGPFPAGGTGDAMLYYADERQLEVVDLKNGVGVVEAKENAQLRSYGLGALLANPGLPVDTVKVTIVQPRARHRAGTIRSEILHVADLCEWTGDLLEAMRRAKQAADEHTQITGELSREAWSDRWLSPGGCTFCKAAGFCPALRKRAQDVAGLWFDDQDKPRINTPADQSAEAVARDLEALDMLEDWIRARREFAHALAEGGTAIPGYKLVERHGNRKWGAPEAKVVADLVAVAGLDADDVYERKLKTPAAVDKLLGKSGAQKITSMWLRPVTGKSLVRADASDQPAAASVAERYFEEH